MRVLVVGDVVGKPGRQVLARELGRIVEEYNVDFVIANGENAAGGNGITRSVAEEMFDSGVDVITMGNHVWDKKELVDYIETEPRIIRPANYPPGTPGRGFGIFEVKDGESLAVINLAGRVFMEQLDCPFRCVKEILRQTINSTVNTIVDFHAETTSEKGAMGYWLDGQVSAVCGTHTHVQTADAKILPKGTAFITDLGMTGPANSVLGIDPDLIVEKFVSHMPVRFQLAKGPSQFNGAVIEINSVNGLSCSIESINLPIEV
ncbi:MAG: TIGR00282 family metallophosphoesterase [Clostridia bacterium]|nr:TIGR00282 family metallophosphoesterase [Clostridia bacterium]